MKKMSASTQIFFLVLFVVLVLASKQVNFVELAVPEGTQGTQHFTLLQFFGPIAGGILGPLVGAAVVLYSLAVEFFIKLTTGSASFDVLTLLRFLPAVFAAWYFGVQKGNLSFRNDTLSSVASIGVPLIATALFLLHPVGKQAWFFPLIFWSVPIVAHLSLRNRNLWAAASAGVAMAAIALLALDPLGRKFWILPLIALFFWSVPVTAHIFRKRLFMRSLGSTFAAHSVGGVIWIWYFPTTPEFWLATLIPLVVVERLLFASGITLSFSAVTTLLANVESRFRVPFVSVDRRYALPRRLFYDKCPEIRK